MIDPRLVLNPARYHGHGREAPFFEGWYFKLVDTSERHRYAVIPGVSLGPGGEGPHAFVQLLDGVTGETAYHTYPLEDFRASRERFDVEIGPNCFSMHEMTLDLPGDALAARGRVELWGTKPWPVTWRSPGVMGWYAWVPGMETYHGVLSMDHAIHGALEIGGERVDFTWGRGYIEKDWGQSFPSAWVWTQTNHFDRAGTCLTASIAMIPWLGWAFRGFIVGLLRDGILYRFATYTGAETTRLVLSDEVVHWEMRDGLYRLLLTIHRATSGDLRGPSKENMGLRVPETLRATVDVRLVAQATGETIFEGTGRNAGLEVAGDLGQLVQGSAG